MTKNDLKSPHGLVNDIIIFIKKFVQEINNSKKIDKLRKLKMLFSNINLA